MVGQIEEHGHGTVFFINKIEDEIPGEQKSPRWQFCTL